MPVRVQMIGGRGVGGGGVPLLAIVSMLVILVALAAVMLPLVLIAGGVGVLALGAMRLRRWAFGGGGGQSRQTVESSDFDTLRAKLEARSAEGLRGVITDDPPAQETAADVDDHGRRNVRVIDSRQ